MNTYQKALILFGVALLFMIVVLAISVGFAAWITAENKAVAYSGRITFVLVSLGVLYLACLVTIGGSV